MKARIKETGEIIDLAEQGIISHDGRRFTWYQVDLIPERNDDQHSLPPELDEAAEDMLDDAAYDWVMDNFGNPKESLFDFDCRCFKAGAGWMAGQGETHEAEIIESVPFSGTKWRRCIKVWLDDQFQAKGDKVVVQIRKK